jgi:hypothetical protein
MMIKRTFTRSNVPCNSSGMGFLKSRKPRETFSGSDSVGRYCSEEMSKPWKVWVGGDMAARSLSQIPVPVATSATRASAGSVDAMEGWRR